MGWSTVQHELAELLRPLAARHLSAARIRARVGANQFIDWERYNPDQEHRAGCSGHASGCTPLSVRGCDRGADRHSETKLSPRAPMSASSSPTRATAGPAYYFEARVVATTTPGPPIHCQLSIS